MENELVIFNKYTIIENCIKRINSVYDGKLETLKDFNKQDVIVLNLQRACQAVIDIAMHIISVRNLGAPQSGKGAWAGKKGLKRGHAGEEDAWKTEGEGFWWVSTGASGGRGQGYRRSGKLHLQCKTIREKTYAG